VSALSKGKYSQTRKVCVYRFCKGERSTLNGQKITISGEKKKTLQKKPRRKKRKKKQ